ncbi:MAG: TRAP transporter substrate-binding protein [Burkholderiaceae bacterium]|jgi:TRAP-type mannitol/chloroaromatic compound transport system substrate-binding protein|nr:twin-arginine translocation signal domain-containing protein [Betaproteobacteria bacterium]
MERRSFVKHAGVAGILAAGTAPAVQAQQSIRWRITSSFPKSLDTLYGAAEVFAKQVTSASGGRLTVTAHPPGELVPAFGVVDAVQKGTVEGGHTAPYYFFGKDETFALDCAVPFGMNSRQMTAWMYHGNGLKLTRDFYRQYDIVNFPAGNTGVQMGGWYRKEIKSVEDLKGLKFRVGGFAGRVLERLGVVPQNIPGGEIYPALEKGTIDAAEWVGPYDDLKLGFYKVAKNYYYPGFWEGGPQLSIYLNAKTWEALPADLKAIVEAAASHAHVDMQARYDALNPQALRKLIAEGTRVAALPRDVLQASFKAAHDVYAEVSAKNQNWAKMWADYSRFRGEQYQWFNYAERSYDNFMFSQKL